MFIHTWMFRRQFYKLPWLILKWDNHSKKRICVVAPHCWRDNLVRNWNSYCQKLQHQFKEDWLHIWWRHDLFFWQEHILDKNHRRKFQAISHLTINSINVHWSLFLLHWESVNKAHRETLLFIPPPVAKTLFYGSIYLMWQRSWAVVTHKHWFEQDFHLFHVKLLRHPRCDSFPASAPRYQGWHHQQQHLQHQHTQWREHMGWEWWWQWWWDKEEEKLSGNVPNWCVYPLWDEAWIKIDLHQYRLLLPWYPPRPIRPCLHCKILGLVWEENNIWTRCNYIAVVNLLCLTVRNERGNILVSCSIWRLLLWWWQQLRSTRKNLEPSFLHRGHSICDGHW